MKSIPAILAQGDYQDQQILEALRTYLLKANEESKRFPGFPATPYKLTGRRLQSVLKERNVPSEEIAEMFDAEFTQFKKELAEKNARNCSNG